MADAIRVLTIPGWTGSGSDHWQSIWERERPAIERVAMPDWDRPDRAAWVATLEATVAEGPPPVLVAHSLGCLAVVHWAEGLAAGRVRGALLVAPPDVERDDVPEEIAGFGPIPMEPLPFRAVVVASRTDPWTAFDRSAALARAWGASLVDAGEAGHLNTDAGYGPWPSGEVLLARLARPGDPG